MNTRCVHSMKNHHDEMTCARNYYNSEKQVHSFSMVAENSCLDTCTDHCALTQTAELLGGPSGLRLDLISDNLLTFLCVPSLSDVVTFNEKNRPSTGEAPVGYRRDLREWVKRSLVICHKIKRLIALAPDSLTSTSAAPAVRQVEVDGVAKVPTVVVGTLLGQRVLRNDLKGLLNVESILRTRFKVRDVAFRLTECRRPLLRDLGESIWMNTTNKNVR